MNREAWLTKATTTLAKRLFGPQGLAVPEVAVSVGWPSKGAVAAKSRRIGECWYGTTTDNEVPQVFISPVLADPVEVLAVLVHELLHATLGSDAGHKAPFKRAMPLLGLEGKATATSAGDELRHFLTDLSEKLGEYPHSKIKAGAKERTQTTRLIKAECPECGYTVRVTRKWLEMENPNNDFSEAGAPICPIDRIQMEADSW